MIVSEASAAEIIFNPAFAPMHLVWLFIFGALFGSFFNVCIYRIPMGLSISRPGSHCYRCGTPVAWYDNIPLLSYWILRGQCRHCGAGFSSRYFFIELMTACLFLLIGWRIGYSLAVLPALIFASLLIVATFTDIDHWIIPHRISVGGIVAGIALAAIPVLGAAARNPLAGEFFGVPAPFAPLGRSLAGAAVGFGSLWLVGKVGTLVFKKEAMGFGDVILFGMFGAFLGPSPLLMVLVLACIVGTVFGLTGIMLARLSKAVPAPAVAPLPADAIAAQSMIGGLSMTGSERLAVLRALLNPGVAGAARHHLPFGPSLALAALVVYLFHDPIAAWFEQLMLGTGGLMF